MIVGKLAKRTNTQQEEKDFELLSLEERRNLPLLQFVHNLPFDTNYFTKTTEQCSGAITRSM